MINFNYDVNQNLVSITQSWNGQSSHQWVAFNWGTRTMQSSFSGTAVIGPKNGKLLPVITGVTLNDTSQVTFEYTNSLQVYLIRDYFGALQRSETTFTYETRGSDVPRSRSFVSTLFKSRFLKRLTYENPNDADLLMKFSSNEGYLPD